MEVDAQTTTVRADGQLLTCRPAGAAHGAAVLCSEQRRRPHAPHMRGHNALFVVACLRRKPMLQVSKLLPQGPGLCARPAQTRHHRRTRAGTCAREPLCRHRLGRAQLGIFLPAARWCARWHACWWPRRLRGSLTPRPVLVITTANTTWHAVRPDPRRPPPGQPPCAPSSRSPDHLSQIRPLPRAVPMTGAPCCLSVAGLQPWRYLGRLCIRAWPRHGHARARPCSCVPLPHAAPARGLCR